ncbi:MAG TPA: lipopolysaccharide biosynthesis protein [Candidatus Limnocylindria bacterium]|nr:lipopolysaccharide biosynthesis protein [Candidatus Limnocylindria bacterium]
MTRSATTLRAAAWAFAATAGTRAITLVALAILARLLAPRDFGLLAFALVYLAYAETIGDLGTTVALIYWPDRREDVAQLTFLVNIAMGVAWFLLTLALAPVIASFFDNPEAAPIVRTLAFAFLIKSLGNTHDGLAQKDLRFRARAIPELGLATTKALISIALAVAGFGVWSLVWGHLAGLAAWTAGAWAIVPWRPRFAIPRGLIGPMVRYGRGIVAVNVIAAVVHHADLIVVGRMLGSAALGFYQIAYKIPEASITVVIWVAAKVLFPAFSRLEGSVDDLRRAYLKALQYVSFVTVPMAAGLYVSARPLVLVFFGPRWEAAIPLLQWLAVYMGVRSLGTHAGDILKATGRSGLLAGLGVAKAAVLVPALIAAGNVSAEAVAMTLAVVSAATSLLNVAVAQRILRFTLSSAVRAIRTSVIAGAGLVAAGLLLAPALRPLGPAAELSILVAVCGTVYVAIAAAMDRGLVAGLIAALPLRGRRAIEAREVESWR